MPCVLVTAPYLQRDLDRYRERFDERGIDLRVPPVEERVGAEDLHSFLEGVDAVICGDDAFTAEVIEGADRLRAIVKWGTGIDSIDTEAAEREGVAVLNTPDAFTDPVADTVLGYVLSFARRIPWTSRAMKSGSWRKPGSFALFESTVGVIGVGDIGKAVVRRARACGARVLGNDVRDIKPAFREQYDVEMVSKETLLRNSDFVSLNCDLNPSSRGMIGEPELAAMNERSVLINTARGPIVQEDALVKALENGSIAGAGLDVFEQEPLPADSPLKNMDNVLLSPHSANGSPTAWERVHDRSTRLVIEALESKAD